MLKKVLLIFLFFSSNLFPFSKKFSFLNEGLSINGLSGGIFTPSSIPLPYKKYAVGLHNYRIKFSYGIFHNIEAGVIFDSEDIERITSDTINRFNFGIKYSFLKEPQFPVSIASGLQGAREGQDRNFFFSISKFFDYFNGMNLQIGGRVYKEDKKYKLKNSFLLDFLIPYGMVIFDFNGSYNIGLRIFLSRFTSNLKFDLFLSSIRNKMDFFENLYIGFTWSE